MPPILSKKMAGLPTWAWLALASAGIGVGLYLRSKASPESETGEAEDPCDSESTAYNPEACEATNAPGNEVGIEEATTYGVTPEYPGAYPNVGGAEGSGGSGQYQPYAPEQGEGAVGFPAPYYTEGESPLAPTSHELATAEEGGVETGSTTVVKINVSEAHGGSKGCNGKKKPKAKKGYKIVCQGGKWAHEPVNANQKHKSTKAKGSHHLTGGGAPSKQHNKTAGHGKKKKHKAKH